MIFFNPKTGDVYKKEKGITYSNLRTGIKGEITKELADKNFESCVGLSELISEFPLVELFINKIGLKIKI